MRVLAVTPYYAPEGGGLERYAHEILRRMAKAGHDVRTLAFTRQGPEQERRDGVEVHQSRPSFVLGNTPIDASFTDRATRMIQSFEPDVMVAHTPVPFPAQAAFLAARKAEVPFVPTYHAGRLRGGSKALDLVATLDRMTFERKMLAQSQHLIAVGPFVRDNALAQERERVTIIPPGVDADAFAPAPERDDEREEILFVGPLDRRYRWKGVDVLWDAFRIVRKERPQARLTLIGAGDRLPEFSVKAKEFPGAVTLPGRLGEEELIQSYQQASMVVLPSITDAESFGMVLAEANACGRPVVASDVGGIPDFVRHGDNGYLAPPGDPQALAVRMLDVLADPTGADAMGRRGRARVLHQHDWDELSARSVKVLDRARTDPMGTSGPA